MMVEHARQPRHVQHLDLQENRADGANRIHPNLADKDGHRADLVKMGLPPDFPQDMRTVVAFQAGATRWK
jgi:hypothetical protein